MYKASEQRIYVYPIGLEGKLISPATPLMRTVWDIHHTHPFHTWGYVKWQGEKMPVKFRGAGIWYNFNTATDTDWEKVSKEIRLTFE